ncbi:unnamed protein product [Rhizopus stolonifer]
MDIQGYIPPSEEHPVHHYAESQSSLPKSNIPTILPTLVEEDAKYSPEDEDLEELDEDYDQPSSSQVKPRRLNPALMFNRYDKRKSSPAILGLPFGLKHEKQLSVHLSQQRNSIEAAMLLANFNKLMPTPNEHPGSGSNSGHLPTTVHWQDDMSIPQNKPSPWTDGKKRKRRYSYDMTMSWQTMPEAFRERSDLLNRSPPLPPPSIKKPEPKISYEQPPYDMRMYHPAQPIAPHGYRYPPPPPLHPQEMPMLHPLSRPPDMVKRDEPQYYTYSFPPHPPPPQHMGQRFFYPVTNPKLPLPPHHGPSDSSSSYTPPVKKRKKRYHEEDEQVVTREDEFPDMAPRDVEAARKDPEARPRKQKLRFTGDQYTPQWVRYNGQSKEGLCDTCKPGKWLQLKNSAYWYHKQFFHGISSVSGKEFVQPLETRWMDQDLVEGLCHQCHSWVAVSNVKRKNSVLWYRHAHKCHVYHKPKSAAPKKR